MSKNLIYRLVSSFFLISISIFAIIKGSIIFNILLSTVALISVYEWYKMSLYKFYFIPGIFFLLFSFFTVFLIRNDDLYLFNFLILLFTCILSDIGGFVFGKLFKGPKLTKISPNKTYTGVLGSFISPVFFMIYFIEYLNFFFLTKIDFNYSFVVNLLIISFISQIGDLIVSFFKRLSKVKDSGNIIPGHGGILDRIDGMIFAIPFSYWFNIL